MDLWSFAVETYGQDGVSADCLALQDGLNVNVPLLLWAAWAEATGHVVDASAVAEADLLVAPWHNEVVLPLCALRQRLKQGPPPAPSTTSDALREKIKATELGAEKIELETLAGLPLGSTVGRGDHSSVALRHVAEHYARRDLSEDEVATLDRIAVAARSVSTV